jgi:hypothetical protein
MKTPDSMQAELSHLTNGAQVDLKLWIGYAGTFSLAVGYASFFWPEFVEFEGYILRKGFSETSVRGFEQKKGSSRKSVEWVMNHLHIADIHYRSTDASKDKFLLLGNVIKEIYQAKLQYQFPNRLCIVEFLIPDDPEDFVGYQISFWQKDHE